MRQLALAWANMMCVGDYHKFEPKIEEFLLEVFVQQFVFAEVKCKMSVFSPVRHCVSLGLFSLSLLRGRFKLFLPWLTGVSAAEQPSTAAEITPHGLLAVCFTGLIFVGRDAEGALHRKEYLTLCQKWTSWNVRCCNQGIFIHFKLFLRTPALSARLEWGITFQVRCLTAFKRDGILHYLFFYFFVTEADNSTNHWGNAVCEGRQFWHPVSQDKIKLCRTFRTVRFIVAATILFNL